MFETQTQDLMPLLEEWRLLRLAANEKHQQVEVARDAYRQLQQEIDLLNGQIASLNATIDYCIDNDMDPTQAKLTMSDENHTNNYKSLSKFGAAMKMDSGELNSHRKLDKSPSLLARVIQAIKH